VLRSELYGKRVLVVDDNENATLVLTEMLQALSFGVTSVSSGQAALDAIQTAAATGQGFDIAMLDWQMPGMDGLETTARLQQWCAGNGIPLPPTVMVTAHSRENLAQRSEAEQALLHGFLVKPVTASMLLEASEESSAARVSVRRSARGRSSQRQLSGMRILVVEDNLINQQIAFELLSKEGALVQLANHGQEAVDALTAKPQGFDLVLMDLQMPVMDGFGATRLLRGEMGFDAAAGCCHDGQRHGQRPRCLPGCRHERPCWQTL